MTQIGGIDLLVGWLLFAALLGILGYLVLRPTADPRHEAKRHVDDPPA